MAASFESIATVTVTSNTNTISFTSIPGTFKHLQLRCIAKTDSADTDSQTYIQINSNPFTAMHRMRASGTSNTATYNDTTSEITYLPAGASSKSNIFGAFIIDIPDYANTSKYKTVKSLGGSNDILQLNTGFYNSTSAITSISFTAQANRNFIAGTRIALYGLKN